MSEIGPVGEAPRDDAEQQSPEPFEPIRREPIRGVDSGIFVLGFFLSAGLVGLIAVLGFAVSLIYLYVGASLHVTALLVALIVGRRSNDVRIRSFALGGLASYAAVGLLPLLLVGTCLVPMRPV